MNILYLNTTYQCGGAEKVTSQLFHGMKRRGHQVYQIVSYDTRNSILPEGVHVLYDSRLMRIFNRLITGNHGNKSLHIWYSRRYIQRFIRKHKIDMIHLNNPHDNFLGINDIADLAKMRPMIWTLHDFWAMTGHCTYPHGCDDRWKNGCLTCSCLGNYPAIRKDVARKLFEAKKSAFRNHNIIFTVPSGWMLEQFRASHLKGQLCVRIYNSLDITVWKRLDKKEVRTKYRLDFSKKVIGFIAADPEKKLKGMDYLLKALEDIPDPENYLLLIAGKESDMFGRLSNRGFSVRHLGYLRSQEKLNEFYAMADVLVNSSVYETFGLTNIEAMACGTPVIAFPVCTMPEIIDDSCGWIVSMISSGELSEGIRQAFSDIPVLEEKGRKSRERIERLFSEEQMLDQFEALYKEASELYSGS